jgi:hypothetical protein
MKRRSRSTTAIALATLVLAAGCSASTPTAQKAATAALIQLTTYEVEVQRKIKAENDFYEAALNVASKQIERLWKSEQRFEFLEQADDFAERNNSLNATQIGPNLVVFMDGIKTSWAQRDTDYESLLSGTQKQFRSNRKKLELERGKIKILRGKLQVLSAARTDRETLVLMIAFAKQVKEKYAELDESSSDAATAAAAGSPQ